MVDFLLIGSVLSVTYIESFDLVIQKRKMIGYNRVSDFIGGVSAAGCWITNIREDYPPPLVLSRRYSDGEYKKCDTYDAINIDKVSDIPGDYDGVMAVPVTFIEKWNPGQFEIVGVIYGGTTFDENGHNYSKIKIHHKKMRLLIRRKKDG